MTTPSTRDLLKRLQKIEESAGPESTTIEKGDKQEISSQDDHSKQSNTVRKQGSENAEESYDGSDKEVETKSGNKRKEGSDEAEQEYTGTEEAVSDNFEHTKGSDKTIPAAKGADKNFANYRSQIRAAMRGGIAAPIDKPEFKGNQGLNK